MRLVCRLGERVLRRSGFRPFGETRVEVYPKRGTEDGEDEEHHEAQPNHTSHGCISQCYCSVRQCA